MRNLMDKRKNIPKNQDSEVTIPKLLQIAIKLKTRISNEKSSWNRKNKQFLVNSFFGVPIIINAELVGVVNNGKF
jgi:hypothetical protein